MSLQGSIISLVDNSSCTVVTSCGSDLLLKRSFSLSALPDHRPSTILHSSFGMLISSKSSCVSGAAAVLMGPRAADFALSVS